MPGTKNANQQRAVVLLSGGMDSCVCAAIAVKNHGVENVALLHAGYGQRTQRRERRGFRIHCKLLRHNATPGSPARSFPRHRRLGPYRRTISPSRKIRHSASSKEIPVTYVPFRNAHFLSVAVSWGEVIGAQFIYIGAVAEDSSGYPDCRPEYYRVFQELVRVGTRPETQIAISHPCYLP